MSLQKQLVHINITGSLERKDDSALVIPSKLTRADDVVFDDASSVIVRGGQAKRNLAAGTPASVPVRMFSQDNTPTMELTDGSVIRAIASGFAGLSDYGNYAGGAVEGIPSKYPRMGVATKRLGTGESNRFDLAFGKDTYCIARIGSGSVDIDLYYISNDAPVFRYAMMTAASEGYGQPRVVYDSQNERFSVFAYRSDSAFAAYGIDGFCFDAISGAVVTSPTTLLSFGGAVLFAGMFDAAFAGNSTSTASYGLAAVSPISGAVSLLRFNASLVQVGATVTGATAIAPASITANLDYNSSTGVYTVHGIYGAGRNLRGLYVPSNTGIISAEITMLVLSSVSDVVGRTAVTKVGNNLVIVADGMASTAARNPSTYVVSCSVTLGSASNTPVTTNCFVAGRGFTVRGRLFVPVLFESAVYQSTMFLLDVTAALENLGSPSTAPSSPAAIPYFAARLDYGECAATAMALNTSHRVPGPGDYRRIPYLRYEADLRLAGTTNTTQKHIAIATLDPNGQLGDVAVNGTAILAGAIPQVCDGIQIVEEGFNWGPEPVGTVTSGVIALTPVASGAGIYTFANATGTYNLAFTETWQDAKGNWHESAPVYASVSITAGSGNYDINPTFIRPPTLKSGAKLKMYRTLRSSTDTTLYLAHSGDLDGSNEVSDADLASGEALYTTGDVLPNAPMPACRHLSLFQNRVVASGVGDGSRVVYSKQYEPGYCVEFTTDNTHQTLIPSTVGRAVGTQEVDDRLFILCENGIGVIYGQGPSATGLAGAYSPFSTIITETGVSWDSPKSIARAPEGIWFRSPFGMRLVSRQGTLARGQDGKQVGAEVDNLVSGTCVAVAGDAKQQIRFYQSAGTVLVWDYQWLKWTRFTGHANVDALYAEDKFFHVSSVGSSPLLRYYDETAYRDVNDAGTADSTFEAFIETAWLQFAGIQGFQRLYRLMLLGKNTTANAVYLRERFYYDFSETEDAADQPEGAFTPGAGNIVQVQHHMVKQKCESMKIQVRMRAGPGVTPGRFRLTDLTLQVGVKPGYYKLPSSQRF